MHSSRLTQDQKFSAHLDGVKTNRSTVEKKKGGPRGRKAVNDVSNSKNVIPIGEDDLGASNKAHIPKAQSGKKAQVSGVKTNGSTVEKNKGGGLRGRKALTDSVKPQQEGLKKKVEKKSAIVVAEDEDEDVDDENVPLYLLQERVSHIHDKCIKARKARRFRRFWINKKGVSCQSVSPPPPLPSDSESEDEDPMMIFRSSRPDSPIFGRPNFPRPPSPNRPRVLGRSK